MKKRVGGESSESKEGEKAAAKVRGFPRVEGRGRCGGERGEESRRDKRVGVSFWGDQK